jgi:hypothetical protein
MPLLTLAVVLSACQVERTPREYFDHALPIQAERADAAEELRDRVHAFAMAVGRQDAAAAPNALAPAAEVRLVGPVMGDIRLGPGEMGALIDRVGQRPGAALSVDDVEVTVGPRANVAWFAARFQVVDGAAAQDWNLTGVYAREEGAWRLVQAHLAPTLRSQGPYPPPAADPAAGGADATPGASEPGAP